jgi:hypothetical protein
VNWKLEEMEGYRLELLSVWELWGDCGRTHMTRSGKKYKKKQTVGLTQNNGQDQERLEGRFGDPGRGWRNQEKVNHMWRYTLAKWKKI